MPPVHSPFVWAGTVSSLKSDTIANRRYVRRLWKPIIAQVEQALKENSNGEPHLAIALQFQINLTFDFVSIPVFFRLSPLNALPKCRFSLFCEHVFTSAVDFQEHLYYRHNAFVAAPIEAQYCYICQKWLNAFQDPFAMCRHQRSHAAQLLEEFVDSQMLTPPEDAPYRWLPLVDNYVVIWPGICPICLQYR